MLSNLLTIENFLQPSFYQSSYTPSVEELNFLKKGLYSKKSKVRKICTMLLLHECNNDLNLHSELKEEKIIQSVHCYTGVSLDLERKLESRHTFIRRLKKDDRFMHEEVKSNKFFIKYYVKNTLDYKKNVEILTFTEIKYFLLNREFDLIPDPVTSVIWFFQKQENVTAVSLRLIGRVDKKMRKRVKYERRSGFRIRCKSLQPKRTDKFRKSILKKNARSNSIFKFSSSRKITKKEDESRRLICVKDVQKVRSQVDLIKKRRRGRRNGFLHPNPKKTLFLKRKSKLEETAALLGYLLVDKEGGPGVEEGNCDESKGDDNEKQERRKSGFKLSFFQKIKKKSKKKNSL